MRPNLQSLYRLTRRVALLRFYKQFIRKKFQRFSISLLLSADVSRDSRYATKCPLNIRHAMFSNLFPNILHQVVTSISISILPIYRDFKPHWSLSLPRLRMKNRSIHVLTSNHAICIQSQSMNWSRRFVTTNLGFRISCRIFRTRDHFRFIKMQPNNGIGWSRYRRTKI